MPEANPIPLSQCGRIFQPEELELICATVENCPGLTRRELAGTVCELLDWTTATGQPKRDACQKLLVKLESQGRIRLPAKRAYKTSSGGVVRRVYSAQTQPGVEWSGAFKEVGQVWLEVVRGRARKRLWNEYVDRYHYLSYRRPFGCTVRYFVGCERGLLGCVLLAGAAKAVTVRDRWIGWGESQRLQRLPWVVNNTRFLIFPWIRIEHLASHVLGQVARRVHQDWFDLWGYRPLLLETFVDPQRHLLPGGGLAGVGAHQRRGPAPPWTSLHQYAEENLRASSGAGLPRPAVQRDGERS